MYIPSREALKTLGRIEEDMFTHRPLLVSEVLTIWAKKNVRYLHKPVATTAIPVYPKKGNSFL